MRVGTGLTCFEFLVFSVVQVLNESWGRKAERKDGEGTSLGPQSLPGKPRMQGCGWQVAPVRDSHQVFVSGWEDLFFPSALSLSLFMPSSNYFPRLCQSASVLLCGCVNFTAARKPQCFENPPFAFSVTLVGSGPLSLTVTTG